MWLTVVLAAVVALLMLVVYAATHQPDRRGMPPGPKGLPLVGNLFDLLWEDSITFFSRLAEEHGPLYSVQLGLRRVVVINSSHWLTQAFVRQGDMFNHRPRGTVLSFIMGGKGIADAEDRVWRESRRFTLHVLRDFGMGKSSVEAYVNRELQDFLEATQKKVGKPYNLHHDLATSVLNIVWHMFVGERFPMGDKNLKWIIDSLEMSLTLVEQGGFLNYTPLLQFIGTFIKPKAFKVGLSVKHRLDYFTELIEKHKANLDNPERGFDFIYQFLLEQRRQLQQGNSDTIFTDNQLKWLLSDLFIVGLDTTVTTLRWCFLFLLRHPHLQDALFHEIEANIGTERLPTYEDRLRMPYTEAFMTEVFRFGSITPLALHGNPEETTLDGYRIPKRTWIIGNIWGIHWDKKVWSDPENFRPERFLDENGQVIRSEHVLPFSVGRRNCLGESLARIEAFQFLTGMLQRYTFSVPEGLARPSTSFHCGVTLNPHEFEVVLTERSAKAA
ncbi:cytochrome P450 2U1 [Procambarus clarkii]|uniref:cytochrome P450 2U1 n=1 Tax=Procambarus clarkii TaxID=6728 RepID=UPI001E6781A0|nr:cytochrome P450 2U1-like isoform X1 [Procambarus clarkii]